MNDIILYQENTIDKNSRLKKKSVDIVPVIAKKNYYDDADIKYFTMADIRTLIDGTADPFNKMLFLLLYETGARVNEIRNIKFIDIDPSMLRVKVLTLKQRTNSLIFRYLKISDKLMSLILQHRLNIGLTNDDFILSKKTGNKPITKQGITFLIKKYVLQLLGQSYMDKAHPHIFRHTRAIHLLDSGMNIMLLKNFLGHANISNTLIYLKYSNRDMAEAVDRANDYF